VEQSVNPDNMLVEPDLIIAARMAVGEQGTGPALLALREVEPVLADFIRESLAAVAGKLTLSGAPGPLVLGIHEEALALVLTSVQAVRRGHYQLWKETAVGTRLEALAPDLKPKRRRRKKPSTGPESGGEEGAARS
jgi:hypothetical protein